LGEQAQHERSPPHGHLPTVAAAQESHSQEANGGAVAGDSGRDRPDDPAGDLAGAHADLRPGVLRVELRLSTQTLGPRGASAGASLRGRGLSDRRRSGLGEVFRQSSARCPDGPRGAQGGRQEGACPHRPVSAGRCHGRRHPPTHRARDPARGASLAAAQQHPLGRPRQGTRTSRASVRPLCGRPCEPSRPPSA